MKKNELYELFKFLENNINNKNLKLFNDFYGKNFWTINENYNEYLLITKCFFENIELCNLNSSIMFVMELTGNFFATNIEFQKEVFDVMCQNYSKYKQYMFCFVIVDMIAREYSNSEAIKFFNKIKKYEEDGLTEHIGLADEGFRILSLQNAH